MRKPKAKKSAERILYEQTIEMAETFVNSARIASYSNSAVSFLESARICLKNAQEVAKNSGSRAMNLSGK